MCYVFIFLQDDKNFVRIGHEVLSKTSTKQNMQLKKENFVTQTNFSVLFVIIEYNDNINLN